MKIRPAGAEMFHRDGRTNGHDESFFAILQNLLTKYTSPGTDQIPVKLIKARGRTNRSEIHKVINSVWNNQELPEH
jgi:hypothetical protein